MIGFGFFKSLGILQVFRSAGFIKKIIAYIDMNLNLKD